MAGKVKGTLAHMIYARDMLNAKWSDECGDIQRDRELRATRAVDVM